MSFQQGISGLNAAARNLEVIGNNIANATTVGSKLARAEFADQYSNAAALGSGQETGMGVRVSAVVQQFTQGGIRATDNPMDVAINGSGFFQLARGDGSDVAYTRNGQFKLDSAGYIVDANGLRLQGYEIDPLTGRTGGVTGAIVLPTQGIAPQATASVAMQLNLDARIAPPDGSTPAFSIGNTASYSASTSSAVFDAQGNERVLSFYFRRNATDNTWDVYAGLDGQPVPALVGGDHLPAGRITFNPDGSMNVAASGSLDTSGNFTAGDMSLGVPFAASTLSGGTTAPVSVSFTGSTQWGTTFGVTRLSQDGYAAGQITGFSIAADGTVEARYSNGKTVGAAKIALADFRNPQGLAAVGNNLFRATPASGQAAVGGPGSGNLGLLQGGALEESNIDITQQLVAMIEAQRAYQANAQAIKTQDQVQSAVVNMR
ncbi:flagellar hook protein FlgE [Ramlibacter sp. AW1]|uniref:Flagellar hook protein FlgE n=1 Tax=Ramlibacter aurantiacus TaxID=2801330 RepID=A0A936ZM01_9BURK|nr:flagellar hook protein FlgE [Ramlibacter aurantiacus]MBL0423327.1 flagellar hook protein FlgE [Ramlibacter aurantiacus]